MTWLATVPTTNAIICSGIALAWATLLASWFGWHPPEGWLLFVAAHMGIAATQFTAKRLTHQNGPPEAKKA